MQRREFIRFVGGVLVVASVPNHKVAFAQKLNKAPLVGVLVAEAAPHSFPDA